MKSGANRIHQNKIKKMAANGTPVAEISYLLQINEDTVRAFIPDDQVVEEVVAEVKVAEEIIDPDLPIEPIADEEPTVEA